jgi:hypothetical protein
LTELIGPSFTVNWRGKNHNKMFLKLYPIQSHGHLSPSCFFFSFFDAIDQWEVLDKKERNSFVLSLDKMNIPHTSRKNLKIVDPVIILVWPMQLIYSKIIAKEVSYLTLNNILSQPWEGQFWIFLFLYLRLNFFWP